MCTKHIVNHRTRDVIRFGSNFCVERVERTVSAETKLWLYQEFGIPGGSWMLHVRIFQGATMPVEKGNASFWYIWMLR
ncbi:uncharacterized protein ACN427_003611 isoform 3-T6 [Glossina fuscipes fuscipes]